MFRTPKNQGPEGAVDPNDEMLVIVDRSVNPYLFLYHEPAGFRAEQVRSVRNKLVALNPDGEPKTLAIVSAMRGEGKTSTAVNLAMALAELERTEVVLVDADMRRPGIASFLNLEETMGLSDVLQGKTTIERVIHPAGFRNLAVVTAGTRVPNPAEILGASPSSNCSAASRKATTTWSSTPRPCSPAPMRAWWPLARTAPFSSCAWRRATSRSCARRCAA